MAIPKVSPSPAALEATIRSCYEETKRAVKTRDGATFKQLHYDLAITLFRKNPTQNLELYLKNSEVQKKQLDYYTFILNTFQDSMNQLEHKTK